MKKSESCQMKQREIKDRENNETIFIHMQTDINTYILVSTGSITLVLNILRESLWRISTDL